MALCKPPTDVREGAWYLDHHTIPLSIAVEAGQADLFLCSQLGIDFINQGNAVYRLLDAQITCYQPSALSTRNDYL